MTDKKSPVKASKANDDAKSSVAKNKKPAQGPSTSFTLSNSAPTSDKKNNHDKEKSTEKTTVKDDAVSEQPLTSSTLKPANSSVNQSINNKPSTSNKRPRFNVSLIATVALILAVLACIGLGGLVYWSQMQNKALQHELLEQAKSVAFDSENNVRQQLQTVEQQLNAAQQNNQQQLAKLAATIPADNRAELTAFADELARLRKNDPSDWLLHEAEYLARIASRTIWLEHDTKAAIGLLQDADARIQEMNHPDLLSIRQVIHKDIEQLKLIPRLQTEEIILKLMGMENQVEQLSLAMVYVPESTEMEADYELSEDTNDWRENIAKSWDKFIADFMTVSRRAGNVEPLMSAKHQQNLLENLRLKLQVAQWAASAEKSAVYAATLNDIELWLGEYFDMANLINKQFLANISELKQEVVSFDHPVTLDSIKVLRDQIKANKPHYSAPLAAETKTEKNNATKGEVNDKNQEQKPDAVLSQDLADSQQGNRL